MMRKKNKIKNQKMQNKRKILVMQIKWIDNYNNFIN